MKNEREVLKEIITEYLDLIDKIGNLSNFIGEFEFLPKSAVSEIQQDLLIQQFHAMTQYAQTLSNRIFNLIVDINGKAIVNGNEYIRKHGDEDF